jgi:site-specific DNA-adenine methylase
MEKKDTIIDFLTEVANLKGYELTKKKKRQTSELFEEDPYKDKNQTELKEILEKIEERVKKINLRNERFLYSFNKFMSDTPVNEFTKPIYNSNNFISNRVLVRDKELIKLNQISEYIKNKIKAKTNEELINKFESLHKEYKFLIKEIKLEQGSVGTMLAVDVEEEEIKNDSEKTVHKDLA